MSIDLKALFDEQLEFAGDLDDTLCALLGISGGAELTAVMEHARLPFVELAGVIYREVQDPVVKRSILDLMHTTDGAAWMGASMGSAFMMGMTVGGMAGREMATDL